MKIKKLRVHNYRNLKNVVLTDLSDLVVLVGPDESEKSDLLEAIDLFFGGLETMGRVTDTARGDPLFASAIDAGIEFDFSFELERAELTIMSFPEIFEKVGLQNTNLLEINRILINDGTSRIWHTHDVRLNNISVKETMIPSSESETSISAETVIDRCLIDLAHKFKLIHGSKKPAEEPEITREDASLLRERILNEINRLSQLASTRESYEIEKIREAAIELCTELSELPFTYEYARRQAEFLRHGYASKYSSSKDESGELVRLYCQVLKTQKETVLGLEEPEIRLHPDTTKQIIHALEKLGYRRQTFVASHSMTLVDETKIEDIWILRKDRNETHAYKIRDPEKLGVLLKDFQLRTSNILNARGLIFVETRTEKKALRAWAATMGISLDKLGFSIIPIYAKATESYHFPVWIGVSEQLGVPYYFVLNKTAAEKGNATRIFRKKLLPERNLYLFQKNSFEEYFPDDKIIEALERAYDIRVSKNERILASPKANSIEKLLDSKGKNSAGWNILVGDIIAGSMSKDQIDGEIKNILLGIIRDYAGKSEQR